jgi:hypothetical protein
VSSIQACQIGFGLEGVLVEAGMLAAGDITILNLPSAKTSVIPMQMRKPCACKWLLDSLGSATVELRGKPSESTFEEATVDPNEIVFCAALIKP